MRALLLFAIVLLGYVARGAQAFSPLLVVDSVTTLLTRVPVTSESIIVLGTSAAFDSGARVAKNYPAGSFVVDGVNNFTALGGSVWHLAPLSSSSSVQVDTNSVSKLQSGTNVLFLISGSAAIPYVTGLQPSDTVLSNLVANPGMFQATNGTLTAVVAGGTVSNFWRGDRTYAQVRTNDIPGLPGDVANLQSAIALRQQGAATLTNLANGTGGTASNFWRGDSSFAQVKTNDVPGLVGDVGNLRTDINLKQIGSANLTNLSSGNGSSLTNVAMRGLGQPEVSGVAFDGATAATKVMGLSQNIGTNDFSIWVRTRVPTVAAGMDIIGLTDVATSIDHSGSISFDYGAAGELSVAVSETPGNYRSRSFPGIVSTYGGQIADLVLTRSGTNIAVYVNGTAQTPSGSDASAGTQPLFNIPLTTTYVRIGSGTETTLILNQPIYRAAVFNRLLSQADVTSLSNNGIDPADRWGTTNDVVNASTLNGGFETAGTGGADVFGTWSEAATGTALVTNLTTGAFAGTQSLWMQRSSSADTMSISQTVPLTVGARYRFSFYGKTSGTGLSGIPLLQQSANTAACFIVPSLTTSWQYFQQEGVITAAGGSLQFQLNPGSTGTNYFDNVTVTRIGAILDLDFTVGGGTLIPDRSSNSLVATNYGGVSFTLPQKDRFVGGNLTVSTNIVLADNSSQLQFRYGANVYANSLGGVTMAVNTNSATYLAHQNIGSGTSTIAHNIIQAGPIGNSTDFYMSSYSVSNASTPREVRMAVVNASKVAIKHSENLGSVQLYAGVSGFPSLIAGSNGVAIGQSAVSGLVEPAVGTQLNVNGNVSIVTNLTVGGTTTHGGAMTGPSLVITNALTAGSGTINGALAVTGTETASAVTVTNTLQAGTSVVTGTETVSYETVTNQLTSGGIVNKTNILTAGVLANTLLATNYLTVNGGAAIVSNIVQSSIPITTSGSVTNFVLDFGYPMITLQVATNVFFVQSTNRPSGISNPTNFVQTIVRLRGGANNQSLGFNATWSGIGTPIATITNNKIVLVRAIAWGSSETNVTFEAVSQY